jgi:hypothetical protein
MKRKYLFILAALSLVVAMGASLPPAPAAGADDEFKNLKVLPKDISEKALDSVMGHFCVSLGVKCNFCHAADSLKKRLDFASDAKEEKEIARHMYTMTSHINSDFFNWNNSNRLDTIHEVVCYTCHRGGSQPDAKGFLATIDSTIKARRAAHGQPPPPPSPPEKK